MDRYARHLEGKAADLKGKTGELIAYELAQVSFLKDWCFQSPLKEDGKELCDLLIIFDDTIFIWQIKNVKLDDGHYKEKHKVKNINQLIGAYKTIFVKNEEIKLPGYGILDGNVFKNIFLCSVFMGESEFISKMIEESEGLVIHTIHRDSLDIIVNELDTVSDFIHYYQMKLDMYKRPMGMMINGGEKELLAHYLKNNRDLNFNDADFIILEDGIWENLQNNEQYLARSEADRYSEIWEHIINTINEEAKLQLLDIKSLMVELLRPNRFYRRVLSKCFLGLIIKSEKHSLIEMRRYIYLESLNTAYCFMYIDLTNDNNIPVAKLLELGCIISRTQHSQAKLVVGIAYLKHGNLSSYTCILYDGDGLTTEEYENYRKQFNRTVEIVEFNEEEYPEASLVNNIR
ncbi:hypothetical protein [Aquella oligotrophica]|uniref:NERD domain-containing protein n=1 Tax=Aquella oligotrophica TaxID=2067065 RepID=A0A2I7N8T5_9NEIS|nr:hypothetical protein [Aquella oligotrophica]AUR52866.1 hypothetical protein CUN60_11360 [Aquella oligotrophica]